MTSPRPLALILPKPFMNDWQSETEQRIRRLENQNTALSFHLEQTLQILHDLTESSPEKQRTESLIRALKTLKPSRS